MPVVFDRIRHLEVDNSSNCGGLVFTAHGLHDASPHAKKRLLIIPKSTDCAQSFLTRKKKPDALFNYDVSADLF